jgi:hypothetical protein
MIRRNKGSLVPKLLLPFLSGCLQFSLLKFISLSLLLKWKYVQRDILLIRLTLYYYYYYYYYYHQLSSHYFRNHRLVPALRVLLKGGGKCMVRVLFPETNEGDV